MAKSLEELLERLDGLNAPADLAWLQGELRPLEITCADVAEYVHFSEHHYTRNLVRASDWYQALLLCWRQGQSSPIHDHKDSSCAIRILSGTLTETRFRFSPRGRLKVASLQHYLSGSVLGSEDDDMHQVSNLHADTDLITLHVYSPPLLHMGVYSYLDMSRTREGPELGLVRRILQKASITLRA